MQTEVQKLIKTLSKLTAENCDACEYNGKYCAGCRIEEKWFNGTVQLIEVAGIKKAK